MIELIYALKIKLTNRPVFFFLKVLDFFPSIMYPANKINFIKKGRENPRKRNDFILSSLSVCGSF